MWVYLGDEIYNLSDFIMKHPGGHDIILQYEGQDISKVFAEIGHSEYAIQLIEKYHVRDSYSKSTSFSYTNIFKIGFISFVIYQLQLYYPVFV